MDFSICFRGFLASMMAIDEVIELRKSLIRPLFRVSRLMPRFERLKIIDSHTGGEPTRVIIAGGPDLGSGPLFERRALMAAKFDHYRTAVINEPRGSDVIVGAILVPPTDPRCASGVIYFNNAGYLNMCGHGTIGVTVTLAHLGRIT